MDGIPCAGVQYRDEVEADAAVAATSSSTDVRLRGAIFGKGIRGCVVIGVEEGRGKGKLRQGVWKRTKMSAPRPKRYAANSIFVQWEVGVEKGG